MADADPVLPGLGPGGGGGGGGGGDGGFWSFWGDVERSLQDVYKTVGGSYHPSATGHPHGHPNHFHGLACQFGPAPVAHVVTGGGGASAGAAAHHAFTLHFPGIDPMTLGVAAVVKYLVDKDKEDRERAARDPEFAQQRRVAQDAIFNKIGGRDW